MKKQSFRISVDSGLCLFYACYYSLDERERAAFRDWSPVDRPHEAFVTMAAERGRNSVTGYFSSDMVQYLRYLQSRGAIVRYEWRSTTVHREVREKKSDTRTFVGRGGLTPTKLLRGLWHEGVRIVLFGTAGPSDDRKRAVSQIGKAGRAAVKEGLSSSQVTRKEVVALNTKFAQHATGELHAVCVRFVRATDVSDVIESLGRFVSDDQGQDSQESAERVKRPVPMLYDSGKEKPKLLSASTMVDSIMNMTNAYFFGITLP
jgi:phosphopantetheine adenylyltransferase